MARPGVRASDTLGCELMVTFVIYQIYGASIIDYHQRLSTKIIHGYFCNLPNLWST